MRVWNHQMGRMKVYPTMLCHSGVRRTYEEGDTIIGNAYSHYQSNLLFMTVAR